MAQQMVVRELTKDELKDYDEAFLQKIEVSEIANLTLPPTCSSGHGWCENGRCYVCCSNQWFRLVDENGNHYTCAQGRGKRYSCGATYYVATC